MKAVKITNKLQDICHEGNAEKEVKILINNVYVDILNINIKENVIELVVENEWINGVNKTGKSGSGSEISICSIISEKILRR